MRAHVTADQPLTALKGVGPRIAGKLVQRGVRDCHDLLFLLPARYQDRTRVTPLLQLQPGAEALVEGAVVSCAIRFGRRRRLEVVIEDDTGALTLRFFHFSAQQQAGLEQGTRIRCFGMVRAGKHVLEMIHPEYRHVGMDDQPSLDARLTPVYPAIEGISQALLRSLIRQALAQGQADEPIYIDSGPGREAVIPDAGRNPVGAGEALDSSAAVPDATRSRSARQDCASPRHGLDPSAPLDSREFIPGGSGNDRYGDDPRDHGIEISGRDADDRAVWRGDMLRQFPSLLDAVRYLHTPPADVSVALLNSGRHPAQRRLVFDELLAHYLSLRQARAHYQALAAPSCLSDGKLVQAFLRQLPFTLTGAQGRALGEIAHDLTGEQPMQRLLQGDVGCGKTVIAAAAIAQVIAAGYQVALMAPTELLAEQHVQSLRDWFVPLNVPVLWLTGSTPAKERHATMQRLASTEAVVVVGTHALYQDDVVFGNIGFVIIDEQHRFGVHQRLALRNKGGAGGRLPHQLIMTATPIPRTLAMTIYADLDVSIIDELPPGRTPVATVVVPDARRAEIHERVRTICAAGPQVYWVCTLIDESEVLQCQDATRTAEEIAAALPDIRVGLVHGRMSSTDKEAVMRAFKQGEIQLLVATTVIEVGVDVPNATLMVIENSERLGLAQLHQLRGRVGRGAQASHCVLLYGGKLSQTARARLAILRESNDGFAIAAEDMRLRGPGEVLGARQTGTLEFRIADLIRDQDMFALVRQTGDRINARQPDLIEPIVQRWVGGKIHCAVV